VLRAAAGPAAGPGAAGAGVERGKSVSRAAKSILIFGAYLAVLGAGLLASPNTMLALFGQPPTQEPWLRVLGLVSLVLGLYYVSAARGEVTPFFRSTLWGRGIGALVMAALVVAKMAPAFILLMAAADGLGALWTWRALGAAAYRAPELKTGS
jgi:hypothetical protein